MTAGRRWLPIVCMLTAVVGALIIGRGEAPVTEAARAERIAAGVKCPTCQGLSVAQSKAGPARAIYTEITRQVAAGASDDDVRAYLVSRYGVSELLRPKATGAGSVVWIAPVALAVLAAAGLVVAFRRWRPSGIAATDDDRVLVAAAVAARAGTQPTSLRPAGPQPAGGTMPTRAADAFDA